MEHKPTAAFLAHPWTPTKLFRMLKEELLSERPATQAPGSPKSVNPRTQDWVDLAEDSGGGGFGGLGGLFGGLGGATQSNEAPIIRTRLRSAISVAPIAPRRVQRVANTRFRQLAKQPNMRGINVDMQGRTAVISGVVKSARDRRMSQLLMRLEPGVNRVENRVIVRP